MERAMDLNSPLLFAAIIGTVIVVFAIFSTLSRMFHKAGPNEVLVVSGRGGVDLVTGGGRMVVPYLQKIDRLSMELINIQVSVPKIRLATGDYAYAEVQASVKIGNDEAMVWTAAERFLSKTPQETSELLKPVLEKNIRDVVEQKDAATMLDHRKELENEIARAAGQHLARMGFVVESFSLRSIHKL
jgi:flotillin